MTGDIHKRQDEARTSILSAVKQVEEGRTLLRKAVRDARAAGVPVTEIAQRAQVTRATVYEWTREVDAPRE